MIIGALQIELALLDAQTLKDKRRVIKSVIERLRNRFHVSAAEIAYNDAPKRCRMGVVMVANETRVVQSTLDHVIDALRGVPGLTLVDYQSELL